MTTVNVDNSDEVVERNTIIAALKGWVAWDVSILNNFYDGRYYSASVRAVPVVAGSAHEAISVLIKNGDAILSNLQSIRTSNDRQLLSPKYTLPINSQYVRGASQASLKSKRTTITARMYYTPDGPMHFQLASGLIVQPNELAM